MFRVTSYTRDNEFVLKLEGCIAGAGLSEIETCWREVVRREARPVRVDLTGVCHVDRAGRELMTSMHLAGAVFVTKGCAMQELVREISESAPAPER